MSRRIAEHVRSDPSETRVARQWQAVSGELDRRRERRPLRRFAAVACAAALAALLFLAGRASLRTPAGTQRFADGSTVVASPPDALELVTVTRESVELRLRAGRASFDVTKNPGRPFVVWAGGHRIRVVGTRYEVFVDRDVRVVVSEGEVAVDRAPGEDPVRIRAGETWTGRVQTEPVEGLAAAPPPSVKAPPPPPAASSAPPPGASDVALSPTDAAAPRPSAGARTKADADRLFQLAQDARLRGDDAAAAHHFQELVDRHPGDPRAGIAALELGRLRIKGGDARGALDALGRAPARGDGAGEAVLARRVEALERAGDLVGCRAKKAEFLRKFPAGPIAAGVRKRCP